MGKHEISFETTDRNSARFHCSNARIKIVARKRQWDWKQPEHAIEEDHIVVTGNRLLDMQPIVRGMTLAILDPDSKELAFIRAENRGQDFYE